MGEQDSSNLENHYKEEQGNPIDIGNNQSTYQRSNSENEYRTRSDRRVLRTQRWLESREQERTLKGNRNRTAMSSIMEEFCTEL